MEKTDVKPKQGVVIFLDALGVKHLGIDKSREFIEKRKKFLDSVKFIRDRRVKNLRENLISHYLTLKSRYFKIQ